MSGAIFDGLDPNPVARPSSETLMEFGIHMTAKAMGMP